MKTIEETKKHNHQCFAEGVAEIDAIPTYARAWEALSSGARPDPTPISATRKDNAIFLQRAGKLPALEAARLMTRMNLRLRRLWDNGVPAEILALAIQLKRDDVNLQYWRENIAAIRVRAH